MGKLTEWQVLQIKAALAQGIDIPCIATEYDVSKTMIYKIRKGECWKNVTLPESYKSLPKIPMWTFSKELWLGKLRLSIFIRRHKQDKTWIISIDIIWDKRR